MNEVFQAKPRQDLATRSPGPPTALIVAIKKEFAKKAGRLAYWLDQTKAKWDARFEAPSEVNRNIWGDEGVVAAARKLVKYPGQTEIDHLRDDIERGAAMLANALFQALTAELAPFVKTATVAQVKYETAKLLAAFPTKNDLTAFTPLLMEEIVSEQPSWLVLAMACRELWRNSKFRPTIAEVLDELADVKWEVREVGQMMRLPKIVAALEQHLAEVERLRPPKPTLLQQALADCGCYVCPDQVGHSVTDGVKRLAGPFTTESEAWS